MPMSGVPPFYHAIISILGDLNTSSQQFFFPVVSGKKTGLKNWSWSTVSDQRFSLKPFAEKTHKAFR